MKASIALLAVGASFAIAQSISDLPPCGVSLYSLYTLSLHNFKLYLHLQLLVTTRSLKLTAIPYSKHA